MLQLTNVFKTTSLKAQQAILVSIYKLVPLEQMIEMEKNQLQDMHPIN
jgi:hypothetical protein